MKLHKKNKFKLLLITFIKMYNQDQYLFKQYVMVFETLVSSGVCSYDAYTMVGLIICVRLAVDTTRLSKILDIIRTMPGVTTQRILLRKFSYQDLPNNLILMKD